MKNKDSKPEEYQLNNKAKERLERLLRESQMAQSKLSDAVELAKEIMGVRDEYQLIVPEWKFVKKDIEENTASK